MLFEFEDTEEGKRYKLDEPMLIKGCKIFMQIAREGKHYKNGRGGLTYDTGDWDSTDFDALVQCAIFGKIIYG